MQLNKELKKYYQPNVEDFSELGYETCNIWLSKKVLRNELNNNGYNNIEIKEFESEKIDFNPIIIDTDDYEFSKEDGIFYIKRVSLLKNIITENAQLIISNPLTLLEFLFGKENVSFDNKVNKGKIFDKDMLIVKHSYIIKYEENEFILEIINYKSIELYMREDLKKLLYVDIKPNFHKFIFPDNKKSI